jgi:hypothetical protein
MSKELVEAIHLLREDLIPIYQVIQRIAQSLEEQPPNNKEKMEINDKTIDNQNAVLTVEDLSSIPWYIKGMKEAPADADFKFTFVKSKQGEFYECTKQLYRDITLYGSVKIGSYEYNIGGKNGNLINAKRVPFEKGI